MTSNPRLKNIMGSIALIATFSAVTVSTVGCTITDVTSSTSGTLDTVTPDVTLNEFVDVRLASIQKEAAQGGGENIDALAELMGKSDKAAFSDWMHTNYESLFSGLGKPTELISRINAKGADLI